ncbi:MAG: hypothetical protein ABSF64_02000 [Bryobacteraceae bacterium]|jgi:uncharacterized protein (TIGR03437 family)
MKCVTTVLLVLLTAAGGFPQTNPVGFATGQSARLVIGQPEFDAESDSASQTILGAMTGLAYANNALFVVDSNLQGAAPVNNRVMVYGNLPAQLPAPNAALQYNTLCPVCVGQATLVLGQPDYVSTLPAPCIIPPTSVTQTVTPTTPVCLTTSPSTPIATGMNTPTAVASDGTHLAVADTLNNRVLIWNTLPASMNQPPDVVVGQTSFTTAVFPGDTPTASSLRGPQGVWIQNGMLFIADTMNDRVLIYNSIPTANGAAANIVLGQPNMTTWVQINIADQTTSAAANNMLTPVSVTSDGTHLFVSDLGYNRVLIWNSIPTINQQPADVEVGQPNMTTGISNDAFSTPTTTTITPPPETAVLCTVSNGVDSNNSLTYPTVCAFTLSFPRFALSDGTNLYIADGGNDRVLIYTPIPTANAAAANIVLGQTDFVTDAPTDGADTMDAPSALAWDGSNLYVADTYNQRILVYTVSEQDLPYNAVLNSFSTVIYAIDPITIGGTIKAGDTVSVTIGNSTTTVNATYQYTIQTGDTFTQIVDGLVAAINGAKDPNVIATADTEADKVVLTAITPGVNGNDVSVTTAVTGSITAAAAQPTLTGGASTASVAPGALVSFFGTNLSDQTASVAPGTTPLPLTLGGVQVYFNGVLSPLLYVSPTQVNSQIPYNFGFSNTGTANAWVRIQRNDGTVTATNTVAVTVVPANPGVWAYSNAQEPRQAYAFHTSSYATGVISVDGTIKGGDIGSICIGSSAALTSNVSAPATGCSGQQYNYTVQPNDSLAAIQDAFIALLAADPQVIATASTEFTRILLQAKIAGAAGDGIPFQAATNTASHLTLTPIGQTPPAPGAGALLCCANTAGAPVTVNNAALPGETILVYATGLGLPYLTPGVDPNLLTGQAYNGPPGTFPQNFVSGQVNNTTLNVLRAEMAPGTIGIWQVYLNLDASLTTDPAAEFYIAQNAFRSNVVTLAIFATPVLSSVQCNPDTVDSGATTTCSVILSVAVPTGVTTVTLTSDTAAFPVPTSVTIPAGATTATFTVTVGTVGATETATVTATLNNLTSTATITLNPS